MHYMLGALAPMLHLYLVQNVERQIELCNHSKSLDREIQLALVIDRTPKVVHYLAKDLCPFSKIRVQIRKERRPTATAHNSTSIRMRGIAVYPLLSVSSFSLPQMTVNTMLKKE